MAAWIFWSASSRVLVLVQLLVSSAWRLTHVASTAANRLRMASARITPITALRLVEGALIASPSVAVGPASAARLSRSKGARTYQAVGRARAFRDQLALVSARYMSVAFTRRLTSSTSRR